MTTIPITVQVDLSDLSPEAIREAIIRNVADRILGFKTVEAWDEEGNPFMRREDGEYQTLRREAQALVAAEISKVVAAKIPQVVEETLSAEFQPMTTWGDKKGPPTTIREMIGKEAKGWLMAEVDEKGSERIGYNEKKYHRLHIIIKNEVEKLYRETIKAETEKIAQEVRNQLSGKISDEISNLVARITGAK